MKKLWIFLQGKKTSIGTIAGAIIIYTLNNGYIDGDQAQLISVILAALGITANIKNAVANKGIKRDKTN